MGYEVFSSDAKGIEDRLNGVLLTGLLDTTALPVGGLTVVIDATTVTFAGSPGDNLTLDAVIAAINTQYGSTIAAKRNKANAPVITSGPDGNVYPKALIAFQKDAGFTISHTGTANAILTLSTTTDMTSGGKVLATKLHGFTQAQVSGYLSVVIEH